MRSSFVLLMLGLSVGCATPNLDVAPWCELGTGEVEFDPLNHGDTVEIVRGVQGGYHIWASVRVTGSDWRELAMTFELLDVDGEEVSTPSLLTAALQECPQAAAGCDPGMGELVGFPVLVDSPLTTHGDDTTVRLTIDDGFGRIASDEHMVVPRIFIEEEE